MQTSDWAEEAHAFYLSYLKCILRGERHESVLSVGTFVFGSNATTTTTTASTDGENTTCTTPNVTISLHSKFRNDPVLKAIDLRHWGFHDSDDDSDEKDDDDCNPFTLYEQIRGWQPFLRRIPDHLVLDGRLLTLIRCNLLPQLSQKGRKPTHNKPNIAVVSRKQWAVLEFLRWEEGVYDDPIILKEIQNEVASLEPVEQATTDLTSHVDNSQLSIVSTLNQGRCVVWQGTESIAPGTIVWEQEPYVVAPYDMPQSLQPDDAGTNNNNNNSSSSSNSNSVAAYCCFHCARDVTNVPSNVVRDAALSCPKCHRVSYCSVACRRAHQHLHEQECDILPHIIAICVANQQATTDDASRTNSNDAGCPLRHVAPFKALLVLRSLLKASTLPQEWNALLDLESHVALTQQHHPLYFERARSVSQYMAYHLLPTLNLDQFLVRTTSEVGSSNRDLTSTTRIREDLIGVLVQLFCAIHVNAISLGVHAVGLFPGLSSMFNHSCNENLTHSWDDVTTAVSRGNYSSNITGGILRFRAVQSIAPDDECCISYVSGLELPTIQRNQPLVAYKFFTCTCPRCVSDDEQGRLQALQAWKQVTEAINAYPSTTVTSPKDNPVYTNISSPQYISWLEQKCNLADVIFPQYHVQKGLAWEQLADALVEALPRHRDESSSVAITAAREALLKARAQYVICRGNASSLVQRVDSSLAELSSWNGLEKSTGNDDSFNPSSQSDIEANSMDQEEEDFCLTGTGWVRTVWEIKTWEPCSETELVELADQIRNHTTTPTTMSSYYTYLRWASGCRIGEIGYGIRTLIMACRILESETTPDQIASSLEEDLSDAIQHVDRIT